MKSIQMGLPDKVAEALDALVQAAWFRTEEEAVRVAVGKFLRRHRFDLIEKHHREDIAWASSQRQR